MRNNMQTRAQQQHDKRFIVPGKANNGNTYKADEWEEFK